METWNHRKQIKLGISPEKVTCEEGLVLMLRPSGMPACVKPTTAERFQELGWKQIIKKFENAGEKIETVPASLGTIINFYIADNDLNTSHSGIDLIKTK